MGRACAPSQLIQWKRRSMTGVLDKRSECFALLTRGCVLSSCTTLSSNAAMRHPRSSIETQPKPTSVPMCVLRSSIMQQASNGSHPQPVWRGRAVLYESAFGLSYFVFFYLAQTSEEARKPVSDRLCCIHATLFKGSCCMGGPPSPATALKDVL